MPEWRVTWGEHIEDEVIVEAADEDEALGIGWAMLDESEAETGQVSVELIDDTNEDASLAPDNLPEGIDLTQLTDEQRESYEATLKISEEAAPILKKITLGASLRKDAPSIRLKAGDCWRFMTWLTTIQNIADMQQQRIEAADMVIASQADALAKYEAKTGKKLWRPGPI